MIERKKILIIGEGQWDFWRPDQEIALWLARRNEVLFANKQRIREVRTPGRGSVSAEDGDGHVEVFDGPACLPGSRGGMLPGVAGLVLGQSLTLLGKRRYLRALAAHCRRRGFVPDLMIVHEPLDLLACDYFPGTPMAYRVEDETSLFPSNRVLRHWIDRRERDHIARAGVVLCSSRSQAERRAVQHPHVYFLPNGSCPLPASAACPPDLDAIPRPRMGYVGVVDGRVDVPLLSRLVERSPYAHLVVIGPVRCAESDLRSLPSHRTHFLGVKTRDEIPSYLLHLDAGLIPFRVTNATETMLPLKMWEYLSAGLPVISTPLAEVRPYARELEAVRCEDDEEGFADAVFDAVLHVDGLRARRRHRATEWSWEARLREMERLLEVSLRGSAA